MRLLLDTHIFLWYISNNTKLMADVRDVIRNPNTTVYVSVVSIWEATVKYQLGKLPLPQPPEQYLPVQRVRHAFTSLALDEESVVLLSQLPALHRDPFDRMLICQALHHNLTLATVDTAIRAYPISVI